MSRRKATVIVTSVAVALLATVGAVWLVVRSRQDSAEIALEKAIGPLLSDQIAEDERDNAWTSVATVIDKLAERDALRVALAERYLLD